MAKIKITVVKRVDPSVIFNGDVPIKPDTGEKYTICTSYEEGQEWVSENGRMPEGFCSWAWRDLYKDLSVLRWGGSYEPWMEKGMAITSCSDARAEAELVGE